MIDLSGASIIETDKLVLTGRNKKRRLINSPKIDDRLVKRKLGIERDSKIIQLS